MVYVFADETYHRADEAVEIAIASFAVQQSTYNDSENLVREKVTVRDTVHSADLMRLVSGMGDRAVVCPAVMPLSIYRVGHYDTTTEIPRMARTDNIWSSLALYSIGLAVRELLRSGAIFNVVDVHYDAKSLTNEHREDFANAFRQLLTDFSNEHIRAANLNRGQPIRYRRIQQEPKAQRGRSRTKFQLGTFFADRLCHHRHRFGKDAEPFIQTIDVTDTLSRTIGQYDGRPFG